MEPGQCWGHAPPLLLVGMHQHLSGLMSGQMSPLRCGHLGHHVGRRSHEKGHLACQSHGATPFLVRGPF